MSGMFGQTRTAKFLLRLGSKKLTMNNEGKTASRLATEK
jgi:hypothetical protein